MSLLQVHRLYIYIIYVLRIVRLYALGKSYYKFLMLSLIAPVFLSIV